MKKILFLALALFCVSHSSFSQELQFPINEINNLYGKPPMVVKNYLKLNGLTFVKKEDKFLSWEGDGKRVQIAYKNGFLNLFSFKTDVINRNLIMKDVGANGYTYYDGVHFNDDPGVGFIIVFHHEDGKKMCTVINSPQNTEILQVSVGSIK